MQSIDFEKDAMDVSGSSSVSTNQMSESMDTETVSSYPRRRCNAPCDALFFRRNLLLILLLASLGIGVGLGAALRELDPPMDKREQMYFRFPGDLLMRMLKALVIPLIVSSLVSGVAGIFLWIVPYSVRSRTVAFQLV